MSDYDRSKRGAVAAEVHERRGMKNAFIALAILTVCLAIAR